MLFSLFFSGYKKYGIIFSFFFSLFANTDQWETTKYLWNYGLISSCDIGCSQSPIKHFGSPITFDKNKYFSIQRGDIVWVKCSFVKQFYEEVLPFVKHPFVMIILDGVESFPSESKIGSKIEDLLSNKNIIHIFSQNCDYNGPSQKISHLPIGVDFHSIAYKFKEGFWGEIGSPKEQEAVLEKRLSKLKPTHKRIPKAFVDFQLVDSMKGSQNRYLQFGEDRTKIFNKLLKTKCIDYDKRMKRSALWKKKGDYAFSISPWGNGLDCHRTWEDLILGCIVIVKTSPLDPLYEGLPVIIVKDWSEVSQKNMKKWLKKYKDAFTNPAYREKLTHNYWWNKILSKRNSFFENNH